MNKAQRSRIVTILVSVVASSIILLIKWYAARVSGSVALRSDALEGVVNVVASLFALGAVIFSGKPADRDHPYGHGKIEYFSSAFEGGLITLAAVMICYDAVQTYLVGARLEQLDQGIWINFGAGCLNGLLAWYLIRQGVALKSQAIEADGKHVASDFYTTIGVLIGLMLVRFTGLTWIDSLMGVGISFMLARSGFQLVKDASAALLDAEDPTVIQPMTQVMERVRPSEIITVHELRAIRAGRYTHVDVHVVVPEFLQVHEAHALVDEFCAAVTHEASRQFGFEGEFHTHVDPCIRLYCDSCAVAPCEIRKKSFVKREHLSVQSVTSQGPGI